MEKSNNTGKIVGALLLGAVVGGTVCAALGVLFAPEKGSALRKKISDSGNELTGALKSKFQNLVSEAKQGVVGLKGSASQFVENTIAKNFPVK